MARHRDERIDRSVPAAVIALLREAGYPALTMEAVAQRAGTTKPAIRRRWKSLKHLVVAALAEERACVVEMDTGCTYCDLVGHLEALRAGMADPAMSTVLPALTAELADDPELREEFLAVVWEPRREACVSSLRKGQARGDVRPGLDLDLLIDLFAAPVVFRVLFGHRELDQRFVRDVVSGVLSGVGVAGEGSCTHAG
ncbi:MULTISPECIES: TetR/AcrR family transcriptional regulator [Amycolatopsis]|uniref:DNA-binding transcriptional regulator, AcrR family n=2 Tax=Amycolatopsis TaxID=1813 RepID=A0A1I3WK11_9PSEU|nr:TetR/AcrR family transcriptional regulator [Amycolatopsis sacchari]SFK07690.1 DNA-binding transcriptional regulator, AcrR family [Amycolatopsis sacchari]